MQIAVPVGVVGDAGQRAVTKFDKRRLAGIGGQLGKRRGPYSTVGKLMVSSNADGSVTVGPDSPDNSLEIVGGDGGPVVAVVELEPVLIPENGNNGQ
jgi:hypothetical protein